MRAKTSPAHFRYTGLLPIEPRDDLFWPIDLRPESVPFPDWEPSARKRPRATARFSILIAFCTGVATALLWQSYGDAAREMTANLRLQLGSLAALTAQNGHTRDEIARAAASTEQFSAMSIDLDVVGQDVDKSATTIAADREPTARSTDQIATRQEPATRRTDQTAATKATGVPASRTDGTSLRPMVRLNKKPTEAKPPQTSSERGKQLPAMSGQDASCFPSASAVLESYPGGLPSWTLRAPGHEGTLCWHAAARPKVSDQRPRVSDYRSAIMRSEEVVGTGDTEFFAPVAPFRRGGSWEGGLP
jgi:hypothetical protein